MTNSEQIFIRDSKIAFDRKHRATLRHNISKYDQAVARGRQRYSHFQQAREKASFLKGCAVARLPELLLEFEKNITARGARVLWARDAADATLFLENILKENDARLLVKSKSMISEEIGLNEHAAEWGAEAVETDLGEFIVQVAGQKPYHILTPAMHKSKEDVASLFHEKFGTSAEATPEQITRFVRKRLREKFVTADVGITGANFLVADVGGVGLTENEGNGLMTVSFPKIHIVIAGLERVIPSVADLPFFFQHLAAHGTGQAISVYNSLLLGPRTAAETDGPEQMYVILLDNGRSQLLAEQEESAALKCIRCGACLNACPIYQNVGGYTYAATYTGPIGSVITPFYNGFREFGHLSFACTVCGRCSEVCPVKIPLHELLLLNRHRKITAEETSFGWKAALKTFGFLSRKRSRLDLAGGRWKNRLARIAGHPLGKNREMPRFAPLSFSKQWKNKIA